MNIPIIINSLKYVNDNFKNIVGLSVWINSELVNNFDNDIYKLTKSLAIRDKEIYNFLIKNNKLLDFHFTLEREEAGMGSLYYNKHFTDDDTVDMLDDVRNKYNMIFHLDHKTDRCFFRIDRENQVTMHEQYYSSEANKLNVSIERCELLKPVLVAIFEKQHEYCGFSRFY